MTVMQALTLAGGATDRGSAGRTKVIRIVDGKKVEKKAKPTDLVQPEDTLDGSRSASSDEQHRIADPRTPVRSPSLKAVPTQRSY